MGSGIYAVVVVVVVVVIAVFALKNRPGLSNASLPKKALRSRSTEKMWIRTAFIASTEYSSGSVGCCMLDHQNLSQTHISNISLARTRTLSLCLPLCPCVSLYISVCLSLLLSLLPVLSHTQPQSGTVVGESVRTSNKHLEVRTPRDWSPFICLWAGGQRGHFYGTTAVACVNAPLFHFCSLSGRNLNLWTL